MKVIFDKNTGVIKDVLIDDVTLQDLKDSFDIIEDVSVDGYTVQEIVDDGLPIYTVVKSDDAIENVNDDENLLNKVKEKVKNILKENITNYISQYWNLYEQSSISQFRISGNENQKSAADEIWNWINNLVLENYYNRKNDIDTKTNVADIYALITDFTEFNDTRPNYSLRQIRELT